MTSQFKLKDWWFWYGRIARMLGLNRQLDQKSAYVLSRLILNKNLKVNDLAKKFSKKTLLVVGAGPSVEDDLQKVLNSGFYKKCLIAAADGATTPVLRVGLVPDFIVTDLDGRLEDIFKASKLGSIPIVHAHGDNIDTLKTYVPAFKKVLGTTQVKPVARVYNFGGFTDGDRCVFLGEKFNVKKIILAGMNFGSRIGVYSKPEDFYMLNPKALKIKILKLKIAKTLIEWLSTWARAEILNLTSNGEEIKGVKKISYKDLAS
ncbi:MAG: 6-hydroxymethylpterin diphosphokinase MptE-like protein [Candidatus Bathyarchaeota archaeon]